MFIIYNPAIIFEALENCVATDESKVFYVLFLLTAAMIIDFVLGTLAAARNPSINFKSGEGINGILRKVGTLLLFVLFIPISVIIPQHMGVAALYVLYVGYLVMEITSIIENLKNLGVKVDKIEAFAKRIGLNNNMDILQPNDTNNNIGYKVDDTNEQH